MIQNDLWNLAQDFTLKLSLLVHTLIHQRNPTKRDVNLSVLAGTLFTISSGLSAPLPVYEEKLSQKLDSLLSHLEAICLVRFTRAHVIFCRTRGLTRLEPVRFANVCIRSFRISHLSATSGSASTPYAASSRLRMKDMPF